MDQGSGFRARHADFAGYGTLSAPAFRGFYLFKRHSFQTTFFLRPAPKRSLRHASTTPVRLKARPHKVDGPGRNDPALTWGEQPAVVHRQETREYPGEDEWCEDQAEGVMRALQASIGRSPAQSNDTDDHANTRTDGRHQGQPPHQRAPRLAVTAQHGWIDPVRDAAEVIRYPHASCG